MLQLQRQPSDANLFSPPRRPSATAAATSISISKRLQAQNLVAAGRSGVADRSDSSLASTVTFTIGGKPD